MTRNSNALMRDEFVLAESDLADFLSGSTDSAINFSGSADLHTPIHPPPSAIHMFGDVGKARQPRELGCSQTSSVLTFCKTEINGMNL